MSEALESYNWEPLILMALYSAIGLIIGFSVRSENVDPPTAASVLKRYGKIGALVVGMGGSIITLFQLLKVLQLYLAE